MSAESVVEEDVEQLLNSLPDEARDAFESGEKWRWTPDHASLVPRPVYDDDYGWRKVHYERGILIDGGRVYEEIFRIEGPSYDWERIAKVDYGSNRHEMLLEKHFRWDDPWSDYEEWAAENGTDPLGHFSASRYVKLRWRVAMQEKAGQLRIIGARRISPPDYRTALYVRPNQFPESVETWCIMVDRESESGETEYFVDPSAAESKDDVRLLLSSDGPGTGEVASAGIGIERKRYASEAGIFLPSGALFVDTPELQEEKPSHIRAQEIRDAAS